MNSRLHNLHHLLSNELLVGSLSVAGGLNLSWCFLGESNAEHSDDVSIEGLGLSVSLNKRVPLLDHGASLISGNVHTVEVGVAVEFLDLLNLELDDSPGVLVLVLLVQVGVGDLEDASLERFGRDF